MKAVKRIKAGTKAIGETFKTKVLGYLLAGFGLVAGLAWNEAIKALIEHFFPANEGSDLAAKFIYAGVVTLFVVVITIVLARVFKQEEQKKN